LTRLRPSKDERQAQALAALVLQKKQEQRRG
jgi:hypothetical protein